MPLGGGSSEVVWRSEGRVHFSWDVGLNWTPDGTRLLLATYDPDTNSQQLYTFNPDTREKVKVGEPLAGDDQATHMRLSPDGRTVVFSRGDSNDEIWAVENLLAR